MGFFGFLDRLGGHLPAGSAVPQPATGVGTRIVRDLLDMPLAQRDPAWSGQLLAHLADAELFTRTPSVVQGSGFFPYFALHGTPGEPPGPPRCIRRLKDDLLLTQGLGVVLNPRGEDADWAFSYGDILHFHLYGRFYPLPEGAMQDAPLILPPDGRLPRPARAVLRAFLARLGVAGTRIRWGAQDHAGAGSLELVFGFSPQDFHSLEAFQFAMNNLSWFLPKHYSYTVAGNQARNDREFELL